MTESFDFVIAGGGAAGCVLAARLTEESSVRVLLLEAGPDYEAIPSALDDGLGHPPVGNHDWGFKAQADAASGRQIDVSRGKVIGGSSTTNAAFALRGHPADYDAWAASGHDGWAWDDVLPAFIALERDLDHGDRPYHGTDGPIPIRRYRGDDRSPLAATLHRAIAATGVPEVDDHNAPGAVGVGPLPVNEVDGRRMGVASTYLAEARRRPNLTVRGDTLVDKVEIRDGRAVGLRTAAGDTVSAGHVVVSAGAYASPAILLRSGIGPGKELDSLGIDVVADNDSVGAGLADHPAVSVDMAYAGDAPACRLMQTVATFRSDGTPANGPPDSQLFGVGPWPGDGFSIWVLVAALVKPRSRGRVQITSTDPADPPRIELGYFNDAADVRRHVEAFRRALDVVRLPDVAAMTAQVLNPLAGDHDADLEAHIRANAWSYHHPVGTCAMGSVVDTSGSVLGLDGLSVIDASTLPEIPSANTHLATVMIAERLAPVLRDGTAITRSAPRRSA